MLRTSFSSDKFSTKIRKRRMSVAFALFETQNRFLMILGSQVAIPGANMGNTVRVSGVYMRFIQGAVREVQNRWVLFLAKYIWNVFRSTEVERGKHS